MNRLSLLNIQSVFVFTLLSLFSSPLFAQLQRETDADRLIQLKTHIESHYAASYRAHHHKPPQDLLDAAYNTGQINPQGYIEGLFSGNTLRAATRAHQNLSFVEAALKTRDRTQLRSALVQLSADSASDSNEFFQYLIIVLDQNFSIPEIREILKKMRERHHSRASASPQTQALFLEKLWERRAGLPEQGNAMLLEFTRTPKNRTDYSVAVSFFKNIDGGWLPEIQGFLSNRSIKYHPFETDRLPSFNELEILGKEASRDLPLAERLQTEIQKAEGTRLTHRNSERWLRFATHFVTKNTTTRIEYLDLMFSICHNTRLYGYQGPGLPADDFYGVPASSGETQHLGVRVLRETLEHARSLGVPIEWQVSLLNYATEKEQWSLVNEGGICEFTYERDLGSLVSQIKTQAQARRILGGIDWLIARTTCNDPNLYPKNYPITLKKFRRLILNGAIESIQTVEEARELLPLAPTVAPILEAKRRLAKGADNATRIELMRTFKKSPTQSYLDANESFILEQYSRLRDARPEDVIRILEVQPFSSKALTGLYSHFMTRNTHLEHPWNERETARVVEAFTNAKVKKGETLPHEIHVHAHAASHLAAHSLRTLAGRCNALF